jgi:hypothetical protein
MQHRRKQARFHGKTHKRGVLLVDRVIELPVVAPPSRGDPVGCRLSLAVSTVSSFVPV